MSIESAESAPPQLVASADHPYDREPAWEVAWDIRLVAADIGHPPTQREYRGHGAHSYTTAINRFPSWVAALRAAGLEPRLCQRHMEGGLADDVEAAAQAAYEKHERPPTCREVCAEREASGDLKYEGRWDDRLRSWGIPGRGVWIADAVAELLDDRHPWQSFVEVRSSTVAEASGLRSTRVGRVLGEFAEGERDGDIDGRFEIERRAVSRGTRWQVRPAEESQ